MSRADGLQERCALIVVDMQEDFCSETGAYARGGIDIRPARSVMPMVDKAILGAKRSGIPQVGTLFTIFEKLDGTPLLAPHLAHNRPFLKKYGFRVNDAGRNFSSEITGPSHVVTKPRYSAFYGTPLDILFKDMEITDVAVCGITANGGVAATVRDAYLRDLSITVLTDAVAAFSEEGKLRALAELEEFAYICRADEWLYTLS